VNRVITNDNAPARSFDEQVEAAEKLTDVARRDRAVLRHQQSPENAQTVRKSLTQRRSEVRKRCAAAPPREKSSLSFSAGHACLMCRGFDLMCDCLRDSLIEN
jgi:hypothetical protein